MAMLAVRNDWFDVAGLLGVALDERSVLDMNPGGDGLGFGLGVSTLGFRYNDIHCSIWRAAQLTELFLYTRI